MKNYQHLTAAVRGSIETLIQEKYSLRTVAKKLGISPSTVSREINKRGVPSGYFATIAQEHYERQRLRSKQKKKCSYSKLQKYITKKLQQGWSPEQISGRLKLINSPIYVCKETIYQFLYANSWAKDEEKLYQYLRYGRKKRKKQTGRSVHRSKIPNRVSIHNRPEIVNQRIEYGHGEGDSVIYAYKMAVNTLNELITGKVCFTKLTRKTAQLTSEALLIGIKKMQMKTVTVDNGTEFTNHEQVTKESLVPIYFADPYCSNQRGANENVNMLLRGYLPKRANITDVTQEDLNDIAEELNNRPRKRLGYLTPNEKYQILTGGSSVALDFRM